MANYPLPPWLNPAAAQGYGELAGQASRAALSAQVQRDQMSQQATQFAIESQQRSEQIAAEHEARQEQLKAEHDLEQQKLAVDEAYKQQQIGLRTSNLDLDQKKYEMDQKRFDVETKHAADQHSANQLFQKAIMPKEQGGEGLSSTQAALKYMAPYMTGTELGRLAAVPGDFKPGNTFKIPGAANESLVQVSPTRWDKYATIPETITNAPTAISVQDAEGNPVGNVVQIPGQKPIYSRNPATAGTDLATIIRNREKALASGTSTAVDSHPVTLPASKSELKKGVLYQTSKGPAVWDGTQFVKQ